MLGVGKQASDGSSRCLNDGGAVHREPQLLLQIVDPSLSFQRSFMQLLGDGRIVDVFRTVEAHGTSVSLCHTAESHALFTVNEAVVPTLNVR